MGQGTPARTPAPAPPRAPAGASKHALPTTMQTCLSALNMHLRGECFCGFDRQIPKIHISRRDFFFSLGPTHTSYPRLCPNVARRAVTDGGRGCSPGPRAWVARRGRAVTCALGCVAWRAACGCAAATYGDLRPGGYCESGACSARGVASIAPVDHLRAASVLRAEATARPTAER